MTSEIDPRELHVVVRRNARSRLPWRWEIWAPGRKRSLEHSADKYATMSEAMKGGREALSTLVARNDNDPA